VERDIVIETGLLDYSVRALDHGDCPALQRLCERCADYTWIVEGRPVSPTAAEDILHDLPPGRSPEDKFIFGLVDREGEIAGVMEGIVDYPEKTIWWIGLLMLAPETRGQGIGRILVDAFAQSVSHQGGTGIMLGVVDENTDALRFWQSLDFEVVRVTEPRLFGQKIQPVIGMKRAVKPVI
jgi:ribosomal protein S18 acetylase RimI-like enzyme